MNEVSSDIDKWRERALHRVIDSKYADYSSAVIRLLIEPQNGVRAIGALGQDGRQSGADSPWADLWQEFKVQVQGETSMFFSQYEETIHDLCLGIVTKLPAAERLLLWLDSEAYGDRDDEAQPADWGVLDDVADELYSRVYTRAADEPLACEDDDDAEGDDERDE